MDEFKIERSGKTKRSADSLLVCSIFLLAAFGFITLYSSSGVTPDKIFPGGNLFANTISKQLSCEIIGLVMFFIMSFFPLELVRKAWMPFLMFCIIVLLCVLPLTPLGLRLNGAPRWVRFGSLQFQPSELVKVMLPLYLAHITDRKQKKINELVSGILPLMILTGIVLYLVIIKQRDFSTGIIIGVNILVIFVLSGGKTSYAITALAIMIIMGVLFIVTSPERVSRMRVFFDPSHDQQGVGYQAAQSKQAVARGSFFGTGIEQNLKGGSIPETEPDFIFSYFAESFGFVGVLLFFLVFSIFVVRSFAAAKNSGETFRRIIAAGLTCMLTFQTMLTVSVAVGLMPVTGIPLPFFSSGGTSLILTYMATGIIINISRTPYRSGYPEREGDFSKLHFSKKRGGWYFFNSGARR
ncbi:MAG: FtsW/RodA/SpoVE family cell cycle protein [Spirochaetaceae bacterium]|jgi:cell division protein FtsW|nr:FtsW/RodA/SpoVE family cell cycle protein [Spirochaetaceae bacterium]